MRLFPKRPRSTLHRLSTVHGGWLRRRNGDGALVHAASETEPQTDPVLLVLPAGAPGAAFLVSPAVPLRLHADSWTRPVLAFRALHDRPENAVALRHPRTGLFLSAPPSGADEAPPVMADRHEAAAWERFTLTAAESSRPRSEDVRALLKLGDGRLTAEALREAVRRFPVRRLAAVEAAVRLLDDDELHALATAMQDDARGLRRLSAASPQGAWAGDAMAALAHHRRAPSAPVDAVCGPQFDRFMDHEPESDGGDALRLLNRRLRARTAPRRGACVVAAVRDEGPYLLEWIAHHRAIGFDHVILYSNDNTDGSDELLAALARAGEISWRRNVLAAAAAPQLKAYGHALRADPEVLDYGWAAFIDLDEFVEFDTQRFRDIGEFLAWHGARDADSIGLKWRFIGPGQERRWRDAPVLERFGESYGGWDQHVKSLFRPRVFSHAHPHFPLPANGEGARYVGSHGEPSAAGPFQEPAEPVWAWIDHYFFKSAEEFAARRTRNRGDHAVQESVDPSMLSDGHMRLFVDASATGKPAPRPVAAAFAAMSAHRREALLALPGVRRAHASVLAAYAAQIEAVRAALAADPRPLAPGSAEAVFMALLGRGRGDA